MSIKCTRCEGTGFLNIMQIEDEAVRDGGCDTIGKWLHDHNGEDHNVSVCDCCGNGEDSWHGLPGEHYNADDPSGKLGPYAYNGGLCECH